MSTGLNADGRLEVFARGSDHRIWHNWQKTPGAGPWNGFTPLGSLDELASGPSVLTNFANRHLHVFARGLQNDLFHIFQMQLNGSWSPWESRGGKLSGTPVPAVQADERITVFSTGLNGELWFIEQKEKGDTDWTEWASLGGNLVGSPAACSNADGRLVVLAVFDDREIRFRAQTAPSTASWTSWSSLTGPVTGTPAAILNKDLRMQIIFPSVGGELVGIEQTTLADLSSWSSPASLDGIAVGAPVISRNTDGRLEAFHVGLTKELYHKWQTAPDSGWSPWDTLALNNLQPGLCADRNRDLRLEVFAIGDVGDVQHTWQPMPGGDPWGYESLGGAIGGGLGVTLQELGFRGAWWFRE